MLEKILITGAGGYIGSVAAYLLLEKGYEVVAVDNFSTGFHGPLETLKEKFGEGKLRVYNLDLQKNVQEVFEKESEISAVIHYAGSCSVNESMENPQKYFINNTCATQNLLAAMISANVKKIIFSSTCAVYGEAEYVPIDEKHPIQPTNPYGVSKRMSEQMMEWYGKLTGLQFVILRYFNVCGATEDGMIGDSKKPSVHLVQNAVRAALKIEPFRLTCPEVATPDQTPIRDYVNVVDLNNAHIKALEYLDAGGENSIINLGTGTGNSVLEVLKKVEEKTGVKIPFEKGVARLGEYAVMTADIGKAQTVLGWKPEHTLDQSIESLVTWYRSHPNGWES